MLCPRVHSVDYVPRPIDINFESCVCGYCAASLSEGVLLQLKRGNYLLYRITSFILHTPNSRARIDHVNVRCNQVGLHSSSGEDGCCSLFCLARECARFAFPDDHTCLKARCMGRMACLASSGTDCLMPLMPIAGWRKGLLPAGLALCHHQRAVCRGWEALEPAISESPCSDLTLHIGHPYARTHSSPLLQGTPENPESSKRAKGSFHRDVQSIHPVFGPLQPKYGVQYRADNHRRHPRFVSAGPAVSNRHPCIHLWSVTRTAPLHAVSAASHRSHPELQQAAQHARRIRPLGRVPPAVSHPHAAGHNRGHLVHAPRAAGKFGARAGAPSGGVPSRERRHVRPSSAGLHHWQHERQWCIRGRLRVGGVSVATQQYIGCHMVRGCTPTPAGSTVIF